MWGWRGRKQDSPCQGPRTLKGGRGGEHPGPVGVGLRTLLSGPLTLPPPGARLPLPWGFALSLSEDSCSLVLSLLSPQCRNRGKSGLLGENEGPLPSPRGAPPSQRHRRVAAPRLGRGRVRLNPNPHPTRSPGSPSPASGCLCLGMPSGGGGTPCPLHGQLDLRDPQDQGQPLPHLENLLEGKPFSLPQ